MLHAFEASDFGSVLGKQGKKTNSPNWMGTTHLGAISKDDGTWLKFLVKNLS
jgi:hypothetical protein